MRDTISFVVTPKTLELEDFSSDAPQDGEPAQATPNPDNEYVFLHVTPVINGVSIPCATFDAAEVLALGTDTGFFEPFTCSCGNAGCAGIWDDAYLTTVGDTVEWRFAEEYFRESFPVEITAGREVLTYRFDKAHYLAALAALTDALRAAWSNHERTDFTIGAYAHEEQFGRNFDEMLAEQRGYMLARLQRHANRKALFGDKLEADVRATLPDGSVFAISVTSLADYLAFEEVEGTEHILGEVRDAAYARHARALCATDTAAIEVARQRGAAFVADRAWHIELSERLKQGEADAFAPAIAEHWESIVWSLVVRKTLADVA